MDVINMIFPSSPPHPHSFHFSASEIIDVSSKAEEVKITTITRKKEIHKEKEAVYESKQAVFEKRVHIEPWDEPYEELETEPYTEPYEEPYYEEPDDDYEEIKVEAKKEVHEEWEEDFEEGQEYYEREEGYDEGEEEWEETYQEREVIQVQKEVHEGTHALGGFSSSLPHSHSVPSTSDAITWFKMGMTEKKMIIVVSPSLWPLHYLVCRIVLIFRYK